MLKEWSDDYSLGVDVIDAQHKGFFEATHQLYDAILNCEGEKAVEQALEFLWNYASEHFRTEEAFMKQHGFPGLEDHKKLHVGFFEALDMLLDDLRVFGPSQDLADRALEIAQDWLIDHILDEDTQYAAYVKKRSS
jgi:hemerythrin